MAEYIPDEGDIVWISFDPQSGHEQAGHRPALILSPARYNKVAGLAICCPMTTKIKSYPFEVLTELEGVANAVLADQVKSIDWRVRKARLKAKVGPAVLDEVRGKISALLGL